MTEEDFDLLDILLDRDNKEPLILTDASGKQLSFEQVAVIPYEVKKEKRLYCILKPLDKFEGIEDDEAIVFLIDTDEQMNSIVRIEEDDDVAVQVFQRYHEIYKEEMNQEE